MAKSGGGEALTERHNPDDYRFMDPELVNLIRTAAEPIIDAMLNN